MKQRTKAKEEYIAEILENPVYMPDSGLIKNLRAALNRMSCLNRMQPITYPARPINGGPFPQAREKAGQWAYEPKVNGWRAIIHLASGAMFNRQGERLSIGKEFIPAIAYLRGTLDAEAFKWVDVEALERRHNIGQGCLILLDLIPEPEFDDATYFDRRQWMVNIDCLRLQPEPDRFPLVSMLPNVEAGEAWKYLPMVNEELGVPFYEGLVAKRLDSRYPVQLRSPDEAFPFWVKHKHL